MDSINTFEGGQNSDLSKFIPNKSKYIKALNVRPLTDVGGSHGALVNIKGNNCELKFPNLQSVFKFKLFITDNPSSLTITVNGQTTSPITINSSASYSIIANALKALNNCYTGVYDATKVFAVAYNNDCLVIYQNPEYRVCDTVNSTPLDVTINQTQNYNYPTTIDSTLKCVDVSETSQFLLPSGQPNVWFTIPYILPEGTTDPIVVIGSPYIETKNYLLTCGKANPNKNGQIWSLYYDESLPITERTTLKLLYHNRLNLSVDYPIAPTACIGRYEKADMQKIYWTDFHNYTRYFNVADTNGMTVDVKNITLLPSIKMSVPTLYKINDGDAVVNINTNFSYQCAYRLYKNNGGYSNFSLLSNPVVPIPQETNKFVSGTFYYSSLASTVASTAVNKSITWAINGLDSTYDIIKFYVIIKDVASPNQYKIYQYDQNTITSSYTTTTFKNDTTKFVEITLDEFLLEESLFGKCKTIEQKDNRLFFGNVVDDFNGLVDSFDAKTYRYSYMSTDVPVLLREADTLTTVLSLNTANDYKNVNENLDLIPVYNLGLSTADDIRYDVDAKYQKNSNVLGGTGPNISYNFGTMIMTTDGTPYEPSTSTNSYTGSDRDVDTSFQAYNHGFRKASAELNTLTTNGNPNIIYYPNNGKNTLGLEYFSPNFRSYQREEIYRFAIVFKSKANHSSFPKWIGDIKFPNHNDNSAFGPVSDFRSMYYDGTKAYSVIPVIKFDVTIPPELADIISGYEIVRVDRTIDDRSIISNGLVNQTMVGMGSETSNFFLPTTHFSVYGGVQACDPPTDANGQGSAYPTLVTYHSFDYLVDGNSSKMSVDDKLIFTQRYGAVNDSAINPSSTANTSGSYEEEYYIKKYYELYKGSIQPAVAKIKQFSYVGEGDISSELTYIGANRYYKNYTYKIYSGSGSFSGQTYAKGSSTMVLVLDTPIDWSSFTNGVYGTGQFYAYSYRNGIDPSGGVQGNGKMMAMQFRYSRLASQYGGRTYSARTNNEYISTGAYYSTNNAGTYSLSVFGGDIYAGILDVQKAIKAWTAPIDMTVASTKHSQTWFFPTESVYNVDLRSGVHVNADLNNDAGTAASGSDEYGCALSYSMSNNLKTYLAKPLGFITNSEFRNRIYWSDVKINGFSTDQWTLVPVNNFYDLDGNYGPINGLITLGKNLYSVQDNALGLLLVNPVSVITDSNDSQLRLTTNLGNPSILDKHFYVSVDAGSKHQWSISKSPSRITFVDILKNKIYLFNGESLEAISDTKGERGFLNKVLHDTIRTNDNPILYKGILTTYDYLNSEFLYTFLNDGVITTVNPNYNNSAQEGGSGGTSGGVYNPPYLSTFVSDRYTLAYSDLIDSFSSYYSFTPYIYINNHSNIFSPATYADGVRTKLYCHNIGNYCKFYDVIYPTQLKVLINDNPPYTKIFDNLQWSTEAQILDKIYLDDINDYSGYSDNIPEPFYTFNKVRIYNESQNTDWVITDLTKVTGNLRKVEQSFNYQIPRNKVNYQANVPGTISIFDPAVLTQTQFGDRIRDKFIIVDLEYLNTANARLVINYLKSLYKISPR